MSGSTEWAHLTGGEAIYFTSNIPVNETKKRGINQEMWIPFYVGDKVGKSVIDSMPHCHTKKVVKRSKPKERG